MKTAFGIFWHDLKRLLRNPFALIVALGLIVLPSVYAWYSIAAMWNPYAHTDGLKVAVVNEDAGAKYDGHDIHVGDSLVEGIRQNQSFDWQFVDADQGKAGLDSGEYYAEFILPDSFTEDFLSVLNGDLKNPSIEYWVNEKHNAVALEVTDAGAGVVDAVVNRVFSALIADAMSSVVKDVAADLLDSQRNATSQVQSGLEGADKDLQNVMNGFNGADVSLAKWGESVDSAKGTVDALKKTIPNLVAAIEENEKLLSDVRTSAHKASSTYSSALAEGGEELSGLLKDFSKQVKKITNAVSSSQDDISSAEKKVEKALAECTKLIDALLKLEPDSKTLIDLKAQNEKLQTQIGALEDARAAFEDAAEEAGEASADLTDDIEKSIKDMKGRNDTFNAEILPSLDSSLDSVALVMGAMSGSLSSLDKQADQAKALLDELDGVLQRTREAISQTSESLGNVSESLDAARSDVESLAGSEVMKRITDFADIDAKSYGSFMASPVNAQMNPVYPLNSYGSGVAPFYTNLAIWVGCFMLIAVIKLEVDPKLFPSMKPWHGYVGRLLLFALLALLQGAVVTVGDIVLGVQAASTVALVAAGLVTAFCFINIVYALSITLKHVGKALAVVFLIVQIPGTSGMYPIQLMPGFFQAMYPWLPFTYGMGAMREAIGGFYGAAYAQCLLWLIACGLAALALALIVRPRLLNLNRLFDRKLSQAGLYITEEHGMGTSVDLNRPVVSALLQTEGGYAQLKQRADSFSQRYMIVRQAAPLAVVVLVVCLGVVSALIDLSIDGKLVALVAFIAAVVVVFCVCVVYEYVNDNLVAQIEGFGAAYAGEAVGESWSDAWGVYEGEGDADAVEEDADVAEEDTDADVGTAEDVSDGDTLGADADEEGADE